MFVQRRRGEAKGPSPDQCATVHRRSYRLHRANRQAPLASPPPGRLASIKISTALLQQLALLQILPGLRTGQFALPTQPEDRRRSLPAVAMADGVLGCRCRLLSSPLHGHRPECACSVAKMGHRYSSPWHPPLSHRWALLCAPRACWSPCTVRAIEGCGVCKRHRCRRLKASVDQSAAAPRRGEPTLSSVIPCGTSPEP
jgi:hypothetical protein